MNTKHFGEAAEAAGKKIIKATDSQTRSATELYTRLEVLGFSGKETGTILLSSFGPALRFVLDKVADGFKYIEENQSSLKRAGVTTAMAIKDAWTSLNPVLKQGFEYSVAIAGALGKVASAVKLVLSYDIGIWTAGAFGLAFALNRVVDLVTKLGGVTRTVGRWLYSELRRPVGSLTRIGYWTGKVAGDIRRLRAQGGLLRNAFAPISRFAKDLSYAFGHLHPIVKAVLATLASGAAFLAGTQINDKIKAYREAGAKTAADFSKSLEQLRKENAFIEQGPSFFEEVGPPLSAFVKKTDEATKEANELAEAWSPKRFDPSPWWEMSEALGAAVYEANRWRNVRLDELSRASETEGIRPGGLTPVTPFPDGLPAPDMVETTSTALDNLPSKVDNFTDAWRRSFNEIERNRYAMDSIASVISQSVYGMDALGESAKRFGLYLAEAAVKAAVLSALSGGTLTFATAFAGALGIQQREKGGYTPKGLTLVGEKGPELVDFKDPGQVTSYERIKEFFHGGKDKENSETHSDTSRVEERREVVRELGGMRSVNRIAETLRILERGGDSSTETHSDTSRVEERREVVRELGGMRSVNRIAETLRILERGGDSSTETHSDTSRVEERREVVRELGGMSSVNRIAETLRILEGGGDSSTETHSDTSRVEARREVVRELGGMRSVNRIAETLRILEGGGDSSTETHSDTSRVEARREVVRELGGMRSVNRIAETLRILEGGGDSSTETHSDTSRVEERREVVRELGGMRSVNRIAETLRILEGGGDSSTETHTDTSRVEERREVVRELMEKVPKRASGGYASGMTIVGERGPELADFRNPAQITPNDRIMEFMGGGSGGDVYNVEVKIADNIVSNDPEAVKAVIQAEIPNITDAVETGIARGVKRRGSKLRRAL